MTKICVFSIGTGHDHEEEPNILVKLWKLCRYANLGVVGSHTWKKQTIETGYGKDRHKINTKKGDDEDGGVDELCKTPAKNDGWTWINDGQSTAATNLVAQQETNVKMIRGLMKRQSGIKHVCLVGHSRGAFLSLRIAAAIADLKDVECNLFLIDPVDRTKDKDSSHWEIHENVRHCQVIVMEDVGGIAARIFKLMTIGGSRFDGNGLGAEDYIRLPGTHGTATQVDGHPIGQVAYIMAVRWLNARHIPMEVKGEHFFATKLLDEYARINTVNRIVGGQRRINDKEPNKNLKFKWIPVGGSRSGLLDRIAGENKYQRDAYFINRQHHDLFEKYFPTLTHILDESWERFDGTLYDREMNNLKRLCPKAHAVLTRELKILKPKF
jgi:hypothetical protein